MLANLRPRRFVFHQRWILAVLAVRSGRWRCSWRCSLDNEWLGPMQGAGRAWAGVLGWAAGVRHWSRGWVGSQGGTEESNDTDTFFLLRTLAPQCYRCGG